MIRLNEFIYFRCSYVVLDNDKSKGIEKFTKNEIHKKWGRLGEGDRIRYMESNDYNNSCGCFEE